MKTKSLVLLVAVLCGFSSLIPSAFAQDTVVTYQGRVQSNGTNFNGPGQFKFALVTSTNTAVTAAANANLSGAFVTSYTITNPGNGYVTPPTVTVTGGGGSGATATATISGGVVTAINPVTAGSGYSSPPTVTIAPPPDAILFTTYWSNDGTSSAGSEPGAAVNVPVADGLFTVGLGNTALANMSPLSATLFQQTNLQLRLWFNNGVNGFAALSPLQNLTAAPYANYAYAATTLTTSSNQPLNFVINSNNVLRITSVFDPSSASLTVNSVGGSSANVISNGFVGGFIAGGGNTGYPNRVGADYASVLGGMGNTASGGYSTAMGAFTTASSSYCVAMGFQTTASGFDSVAMGYQTTASGQDSTAMGYVTIASAYSSTAMGVSTAASGQVSTAMGANTTASGQISTAMGYLTAASGTFSTAMGANTTASSDYCTAMGYRAKANHQGSFVWSDSQNADFASTANDQFLIRAGGGVGIGITSPAAKLDVNGATIVRGVDGWDVNNGDGDLRIGTTTNRFKIGVSQAGGGAGDVWMRAHGGTARLFIKTPGGTTFYSNEGQTTGVSLAAGGGAWTSLSDRNAKTNFAPVHAEEILAKVAALPLSTWNYKAQAEDIRHLGPMAQDFKAAFGLGESDTGITTVDADGVALAAIQGLNQKLQQKEMEIAELNQRVEKLERLLAPNANESAK